MHECDFPGSSSAGRGGSPAQSESPRWATTLCTGDSLAPSAPPAELRPPRQPGQSGEGGVGGGEKVGWDKVVQSLSTSRTHAPPATRDPAFCQRLRKLFNSACLKLLLPGGVQIGSPIRPLRRALVWLKNK